MNEDRKNFVVFAVIAALILFGWPLIQSKFFPSNPPATKIVDGKQVPVANSTANPTATTPSAIRDRRVVLAETPRVAIDTPRLKGSINLKGARIDDLVLLDYKETVAKDSPPIRLLSPAGAEGAYFAGFGWRTDGLNPPAADTVWTASAPVLRPGQPVTLTAANATGQRFQITLSVDKDYMFTVQQTVANGGNAPVPVAAYGYVNRGISADPDSWTIHVGPMSVNDGTAHYGPNWKDWTRRRPASPPPAAGWASPTNIGWRR